MEKDRLSVSSRKLFKETQANLLRLHQKTSKEISKGEAMAWQRKTWKENCKICQKKAEQIELNLIINEHKLLKENCEKMDKARGSKKATKQIDEIEKKISEISISNIKSELNSLRLEEEKIKKKIQQNFKTSLGR